MKGNNQKSILRYYKTLTLYQQGLQIGDDIFSCGNRPELSGLWIRHLAVSKDRPETSCRPIDLTKLLNLIFYKVVAKGHNKSWVSLVH